VQSGKTQSHTVGNPLPRYHFNNYCHSGHADWSGCRKCGLSVGRRYVALRRDGTHRFGGTNPVRLLFIGDSPELTDTFTGRPFTGVSGRLVDGLLAQTKHSIDYCMTNLVGCQTRDIVRLYGPDGKEIYCADDDEANDALETSGATIDAINHGRPPLKSEISICSPHIDELVATFKPKGIVYLGLLPMAHYRTSLPYTKLFGNSISQFMKQEYKLLPLKREARKLLEFVKELSSCFS
jgi:uracil-DNA glycosylase